MVSTYDCDSNDCSIGMDGCDGWSVEVRMGSGRGKRVTKVALVGEDGTWRRRAMTATELGLPSNEIALWRLELER